MNKLKSMSPAERAAAGAGLGLLCFQYFLYLAASIALTITTGYYLWAKDVDNVCKAPNSKDEKDPNNFVNVTDRFVIILKIYFAVFVTDFARAIIVLLSILLKNK